MTVSAELLIALLVAGSLPASADPVRLGLIAGDPVAVTLLVPFASSWSLELAAGGSPGSTRSAVASLVLLHDLTAPFAIGVGALVPTLGVGTRLALRQVRDATDRAELTIGLRVPVGMAWRHRDGFELYFEAAPGAELADPPRLSFEGGFRVRVDL